jgi:hypothetical protein
VDHAHHPADVVAGALIGLGCASLSHARYFHAPFPHSAGMWSAGAPRSTLMSTAQAKRGEAALLATSDAGGSEMALASREVPLGVMGPLPSGF